MSKFEQNDKQFNKNKEVWNTTNPFRNLDKEQFPVSRGNRKVYEKPKIVKRTK